MEGEVKEEKEGILDVKMVLNGGKKINIEMQNTYQEDWAERSLFYNCRMFTEGLKKGESYYELPPCIHVGILDFNYLKSPGFYHRILLQDDKTSELYSSKFQFHVIELSKLKSTKGKASQLRSAENRGRREGRKQGEVLKLIMMVKKKMENGDSVAKIADDLLEDIDVIEKIYNAVKENPEKSREEICEILMN